MPKRSKLKTSGRKAKPVKKHRVVSERAWLARRKKLLKEEKSFTRQRDKLSRRRRALPWVKVKKPYAFETPSGIKTLADLFDGRSQLIIYHFMFGPGWKEGCPACSFLVDHIGGALVHLEHHDVSVVVVSHAPLRELAPYKKRMGWRFPWVSSFGSEFNSDYHVSFTAKQIAKGKIFYNYEMTKAKSEEQPGISVFYHNESGEVFHTYSSYARGGDILIGTYNYLDLTPLGRQEGKGEGMDWMRRHDRY